MKATLNLYFARRFLTNFLSTLIGIFALVYVVDMIETSRRGGLEEANFQVAAAISALRVPSFIEQALPFIILFASIFTLVSLNQRLELVVARAAGISAWGILLPFCLASLLVGIAATTLYNPLAAWAKATSSRIETQVISGGDAQQDSGRIPWLRQSGDGVESILGASSVAENGLLLGDVTAFILDEDGGVRERIDAAQARLRQDHWLLTDATVTRIGFQPEERDSVKLPTSLRPEYVEERLADPEAVPFWELGSKIDVARSLGYNASAFAMQYNTLIAKPALFVAMTLLAGTVSLRFVRTGQSGRMIVGGIVAGFVLYVVTFLAKALGSNAIVPPVVAAWFPVIAAGLFGVTVLLHQEDG